MSERVLNVVETKKKYHKLKRKSSKKNEKSDGKTGLEVNYKLKNEPKNKSAYWKTKAKDNDG